MQVEVPPIYETQLTGFIGQCENTVRGKVYAVRLTYGEAPRCSVDGVECAQVFWSVGPCKIRH